MSQRRSYHYQLILVNCWVDITILIHRLISEVILVGAGRGVTSHHSEPCML